MGRAEWWAATYVLRNGRSAVWSTGKYPYFVRLLISNKLSWLSSILLRIDHSRHRNPKAYNHHAPKGHFEATILDFVAYDSGVRRGGAGQAMTAGCSVWASDVVSNGAVQTRGHSTRIISLYCPMSETYSALELRERRILRKSFHSRKHALAKMMANNVTRNHELRES